MNPTLKLCQSNTAVAPLISATFTASGGLPFYVYSVLPGGAGGSIDPATGVYTAPATVQYDPKKVYDTIQVIDSTGVKTCAQILVGDALLLFCEIIERELALPKRRVYLWDQKIFQPDDVGLYVIISVPNCKPFSNNNTYGPTGWDVSAQSVNMMATLDINIISRDTSALVRKEEVLLALNSNYAQAQQEGNSFYIGKIPPSARFANLSFIDGAAIPYRFQISINIQYFVTKVQLVPYYDTFESVAVVTNP